MNQSHTFSLLMALALTMACGSVRAQFGRSIHDSIPLRYGYKAFIDGYETDCIDCGQKDVNTLTIGKDEKLIFRDTNEWYQKVGMYPLLLHFGLDHDEVLLEIRGGKAIRLSIKKESVKNIDTLPIFFDSVAHDIAGDGCPMFVGAWGEQRDWIFFADTMTIYFPLLFYRLERVGLRLDTVMTKSVNKRIYGKFYGFKIIYKKTFPTSKIKSAIIREWNRIDNSPQLTLDAF